MTDRSALRVTRSAEKDLRRLDPPVRSRVLVALERLLAQDRTLDVRRLTGTELYRLRVGEWRVIFENDSAARVVVVRRVLPRGRAYQR